MSPLLVQKGIVYSKHSDIIAEHAAIKAIGQRSVSIEKKIPLWNPSMNGGAPAFANPQSMYLFPFDLLFYLLPLDISVNIVVLLNVLLAGLSMYIFSKLIFIHPLPSLFCSLAYMLSCRYLSMIYAGWLPKMSMYALTPLLFWSCAGIIRTPTIKRSIILSFIVALCLVQGDMQQLYYSSLGCGIYLLYIMSEKSRKSMLKSFYLLSGGSIIGILLAAPALLPRIEFAHLSTRTIINYDFFASNLPSMSDLFTFFEPFDNTGLKNEFWENNFYFGIILYPLCLLALLARKEDTARIFFAYLLIIFFSFETPLLKFIFNFFPGFNLFRHPSRILILAQFTITILAGKGVEALIDNSCNKKMERCFSIFLISISIIGSIIVFIKNDTYLLFSFAAIGISGVLMFYMKKYRIILATIFCLLPVLDSGFRMQPMIQTKPLSRAFPEHVFMEKLKKNETGGRTLVIGRTSIPYGQAGYYGINIINGYASLNLKSYMEYISVLKYGNSGNNRESPRVWTDFEKISRSDMLQALNVRYIVANHPYPFERMGFKKTGFYQDVSVFQFYSGINPFPIYVWENQNSPGPAYFASSIETVENESSSIKKITEDNSILNAHIFAIKPDLSSMDYAGGEIRITKTGINEYEYEVTSQGNNFLILSQIWYPGWRATLDGKGITLYRTNHTFLGCFIPSGKHKLILTMTSPLLKIGVFLSITAFLINIAIFSFSFRNANP